MDDMKQEPGLMDIEESHEEVVHANGCDLYVTIKGASLVTGNQALAKAREVRALVEALGHAGIPESQIHIENVYAETQSGLFTKSSTARYDLRIQCKDLAKLADALGAVTSQKNTSMNRMHWQYPELSELRKLWRGKCIERINQRADAISTALRVPIDGVKKYSESDHDDESEFDLGESFRGAAGSMSRVRAAASPAVSPAELGLAVSHNKRIGIRVRVEFMLGPRKP